MNPKFYKVLKEFDKLTGCGVLVNTSFNVRGEPVVCSPKDAYRCFMRTDMDFLVLEDYIFDKNKQPKISEIENWRDEYELD
jgi:carbamoyltransferase